MKENSFFTVNSIAWEDWYDCLLAYADNVAIDTGEVNKRVYDEQQWRNAYLNGFSVEEAYKELT